MKIESTAIAAAAPSIGPAVITFLGEDIPVLACILSIAGLLLARAISPPTLRKLTKRQHWCLTALLAILTMLIVMGAFTGEQLGPGMAFAWGVGLGLSGLGAIETLAEPMKAALRAMVGGNPPAPPSPPSPPAP